MQGLSALSHSWGNLSLPVKEVRDSDSHHVVALGQRPEALDKTRFAHCDVFCLIDYDADVDFYAKLTATKRHLQEAAQIA